MGEVHASKPVTDEDKVMSKLHKQHRREIEKIADPMERARQAIPHNQRHTEEHLRAAEQKRQLAEQMPDGPERDKLRKSVEYHQHHAETHVKALEKNQAVLAGVPSPA